MRKLIAAINMTLDGFCDHTTITPDEEIHQHYTNLLANAGLILYGKTTYQLMQFWQTLLKNPSVERNVGVAGLQPARFSVLICLRQKNSPARCKREQ